MDRPILEHLVPVTKSQVRADQDAARIVAFDQQREEHEWRHLQEIWRLLLLPDQAICARVPA
jgi:hypothetical protein